MNLFKPILVFLVSVAFSFAVAIPSSGYGLNQGNNPLTKPQPGLFRPSYGAESASLRAGEEVTQLERFYRVYEDGTHEFKIVLSNGVAQYQKITNKVVNGKTIQVYEGYHSEPLPDKSYRTTYYIADENGYRRTRREFDTKPPVLPPYVPHVPKVSG